MLQADKLRVRKAGLPPLFSLPFPSEKLLQRLRQQKACENNYITEQRKVNFHFVSIIFNEMESPAKVAGRSGTSASSVTLSPTKPKELRNLVPAS